MLTRLIIFILAVSITGCALPSKKLAEFGKASEIAVATISTPKNLESQLLKRNRCQRKCLSLPLGLQSLPSGS